MQSGCNLGGFGTIFPVLLGLLISLSVLGLFAGAALVALGRLRVGAASVLEGFALGVLPALVLLRLLPHAYESLGLWALVLAAVGFGAVSLSHHAGERTEARLGGALVVPALVLHAVTDGAALAMSNTGRVGDGAGFLALAVIVHRIPEGFFIASRQQARGARAALLAAGPLALATIAGALLGERIFEVLPDSALDGVLAVGAGAMLRLFVHSHDEAPVAPPAAARAVAAAALLLGVFIVVAVPGPDDVLQSAQPREFSVAQALLPLFIESSPALLLGLLLSSALRAQTAQLPSPRAESAWRGLAWGFARQIRPSELAHALAGVAQRDDDATRGHAGLMPAHEMPRASAPLAGVAQRDDDATRGHAGVELAHEMPRASAALAGVAQRNDDATPAHEMPRASTPLAGVAQRDDATRGHAGVELAQEMPRSSAAPAWVAGVCVAACQLGMESIALSFAWLGLKVALARVVGSVVIGLAVGLAATLWLRRSPQPHDHVATPQPRPAHFWEHAQQALDDSAGFVVLGLLLSAALEAALTPELLSGLAGPWHSVLAGMVALFARMSALGVLPVVAVLLHKGLSLGAGLTLLWLSPLAAVPLALWLGRRPSIGTTLLAGTGAGALCIALGEVVERVLTKREVPELHPLVTHACSPWEYACAALLGLLIVRSLMRLGPRRFASTRPIPSHELCATGR